MAGVGIGVVGIAVLGLRLMLMARRRGLRRRVGGGGMGLTWCFWGRVMSLNNVFLFLKESVGRSTRLIFRSGDETGRRSIALLGCLARVTR